jgi:hypothetical protein
VANIKSVYNNKGWVLCTCVVCGKANYVEPHGTTAECCMPDWTEHTNIPYNRRTGPGGTHVVLDRRGRLPMLPMEGTKCDDRH